MCGPHNFKASSAHTVLWARWWFRNPPVCCYIYIRFLRILKDDYHVGQWILFESFNYLTHPELRCSFEQSKSPYLNLKLTSDHKSETN